ncbi:MAG: MBL fold metallo-hydrolase [Chloroflexi bacterium]|nr:MBL fold metallo-hydrolase [Chloroflexota bacterium]
MTVSLTFLGTGNAFADGGRSHACILVSAPEGRILLDCGGSALPPLRRACDPSDVDAVAITHLHGDHFGGLPFLAMQQKYAPRGRPLLLGGPPSLERLFMDATRALYSDFFDTPLPYDIRFTVLTSTPARLGPAEVMALPVEHVPASEPHGLRVRIGGKLIAYSGDAPALPVEHVPVSEPHGLRVRIGGQLIAYSGDARWSDALPRLADGADLFICETTTYSIPDPVHLSAKEVVAHRSELRCERVIATHLGRESIEHLGDLGVEHAEDGMVVEL